MATTENSPYVFISYAHRDADAVVPVIEAMKRSGITVWYDEGIAAGSEWPEYIAEKVMNCTKFLLFISDAYLQSQNCKRELNFAISRKKDILSVYLEDVDLSPGMEMQLGTYQAFFRKRYSSTESFCQALCAEGFFQSCRQVEEVREAEQPAPQPEPVPSGVGQAAAQSASVETNIFNNCFTAGNAGQPGTAFASSGTATTTTATAKKNWMVTVLLAFLLGSFGAHHFYLRRVYNLKGFKVKSWVIGLVCCVLTVINLSFIPMLLGLIDGFVILLRREEHFNNKYNA